MTAPNLLDLAERCEKATGPETLHRYLTIGRVPCRSCPSDYPFPATHMATPKLTTGKGPTDWPVCRDHLPYAMCAGWFPVRDLTDDDFAAALRARSSDITLSQLRFAAEQHRQHMRDLIAIGLGAVAGLVFVVGVVVARYWGWL